MPISSENMKRYPGGSIHSPEWRALRERIRERAGDRCEKCAAPNHSTITRSADGATYHMEKPFGAGIGSTYSADDGSVIAENVACYEFDAGDNHTVKVVCTVAHVNHDVTDNADANLKFWCQRCHNRHDQPHRQANAARSRRAKLAAGDLFDEPPEPSVRGR